MNHPSTNFEEKTLHGVDAIRSFFIVVTLRNTTGDPTVVDTKIKSLKTKNLIPAMWLHSTPCHCQYQTLSLTLENKSRLNANLLMNMSTDLTAKT